MNICWLHVDSQSHLEYNPHFLSLVLPLLQSHFLPPPFLAHHTAAMFKASFPLQSPEQCLCDLALVAS